MPIRPSDPICLVVASGNSWLSSIAAAIGRMALSAKSRTISRTALCSSPRPKAGPADSAMVSALILFRGVLVEPAAALPSQVAGPDHVAEQRARPVLRIAESAVQDLHDAQAGVETDQIRQLERPHRVVHAQL